MTVAGASRLRFGPGMKLREDTARGRWVVLGPERLFVPDDIALEVLRLLDGTRLVNGIVDELAARYAAPRALIAGDVVTLLQELADKGVVVAA